ncbi:hypothetical protein [Janthinobacterium fluminis]|uniref:Uncharacterized protein n=1 Tax=Janthinobacterium fluminis TaxID=2987524 RepID=A0ABT5JWU0_9BURK|nr:hypothetical protein [Janthinobacterium fluminis]MDC8757202.1 hypothetical protein [Janthinobacterium fluminis]
MLEISAPVATVIASFVGVIVATLTAVVTYATTKKREREAEIRKEKLEHYKEFMTSLSGVILGEDTPDGQRAFSRACNKLNLVAPYAVIVALQGFQQEIKVTNSNGTRERHDELMSALIHSMRKDLGLNAKNESDSLVFGLWASGVQPDGKKTKR